MRTLFLLLLSCVSCFAQLGAIEQPMFALSSTTPQYAPTNEQGAYLWWVASDVYTNTSATNWIDRIRGESLTNTVALAPTNSSGGMGFDGSHFLYLQTPVLPPTGIDQTNVFFVVLTLFTPAIDFSSVLGGGTDGRFLFTQTDDTFQWFSGANGSLGTILPSVQRDLFLSIPRSPTSTALVLYTNAVVSASLIGANWGYNWNYVGGDPNLGRYMKGYIREILLYTNAISSTVMDRLHNYATNTYGFSP